MLWMLIFILVLFQCITVIIMKMGQNFLKMKKGKNEKAEVYQQAFVIIFQMEPDAVEPYYFTHAVATHFQLVNASESTLTGAQGIHSSHTEDQAPICYAALCVCCSTLA